MAGATDRTVQGVTWKDDLAWMEDMKSLRWKTHIAKAQSKWSNFIDGLDDRHRIEMELDSASTRPHAMLFRAPSVDIGIEGTMTRTWKWRGSKRSYSVADLDSRTGHVWVIEEVGNGAELYAVGLYKGGKAQPIWQHSGVGPFVAVVGDRCYCLEAKKRLVYWRLVSWDAMSGRGFKVHYEETDYRYNLELVRGGQDYAWLRRQAGGKQDAFIIRRERVDVLEGITLDSRRFIFGSEPGQYLVWSSAGGLAGRWRAVGLKGWRLPSFDRAVPEALDTKRGLLITKWYGCRTIWVISRTKPPFTVFRGWAGVLIDPWDSPWVRIVRPGMDAIWWDSSSGERPAANETRGVIKFAKSADDTEVPYYVVKMGGRRAHGLLVVGYGAYGLPTPLMTSRWTPLLKQGWAIAIGLWRGGGDHTPEWEDAGRLGGRIKVLEDAEAVVRSARAFVEVPAKRTVLYGRSAGGLWVGGLTAKFPKGDLAGGAYMEVPYLDVLRTTTNRALPLTDIETDEFGLPAARLSDFRGIVQWSPMELMPAGGISGMWQIVRTAVNDSEVFAYESVKWVERSRGRSFLVVGDGGHFISGRRQYEEEAEDLAAILALVK